MTHDEIWGAEQDWEDEWEEYREENRRARERYVFLTNRLHCGEYLELSEVQEMKAFVASTTASV
jgi:thiamine kinase-like enzyme